MTWVALLLVGVACGRPGAGRAAGAGRRGVRRAAAAVCVGLLAGLTGPRDVLALAVIAAVVVVWAQTVRRALRGAPAWWPLATLAAALVLALLVSGWAGRADGLLGAWLDHTRVPSLKGVSADRVLLVAGVFLANLATGNVLVHLVLGATGTVSPAVQHTEADPEEQLKGGGSSVPWSGCSSSGWAWRGSGPRPASWSRPRACCAGPSCSRGASRA